MAHDWLKRKEQFLTIDLRGITADMLPAILYSARKCDVGEGLRIVHTDEPRHIYAPLEELGFERYLVRASDHECHVYFHRLGIPEPEQA